MKTTPFFAVSQALACSLSFAAQTAPNPASEEAVILSPFQVTADAGDRYEALNTTGITGTNREIRSLPITMEAFTRAFIDDVAVSSVNELLTFAVNLDDTTDANNGGLGDGSQVRLRGLLSKEEQRRNGFLAATYQDVFSLDRAEILRGPQALLYGQGNSAGTVNTMTKRPQARGGVEIQIRTDQEGSRRGVVDASIRRRSLGLRVAAVGERTRFWQENLSRDVDGLYLAASYDFGRQLRLNADFETLTLDSTNRRAQITVRDNSNRDPRRNQLLDSLVLDGNTSGIVIGGRQADFSNYWSLMGAAVGRYSRNHNYTLSAEYTPDPAWSFRVAYNGQDSDGYSRLNFAQELLLPTDNRAISGETSIRASLGRQSSEWSIKTWQATGVYQFQLGRMVKSQVVAGVELRDRRQTFNTMDPFRVDASGNFIPGPEVNGRTLYPEFAVSVQHAYPNQIEPPDMRFANRAIVGGTTPSSGNPLGISGPLGALFIRDEKQTASFVNWLSTWFEKRIEGMAGLRYDSVQVDNVHLATTLYDVSEVTWLAGAVFNLRPDLGAYANYGRAFAAASALRTNPANQTLPPGSGEGWEAGLKFDLMGDRLSGSLAYYRNAAANENANIGTAVDDVDPQGINGRNGGPFVDVLTETDGMELTLTMRPLKSWRVQLGAGITDGRFGQERRLPIYYNDQFHSDGTTVRIGSASGANLLVPVNPANPSGPTTPLTLAMMKDRNSPYFAVLDPESGRITNAAALRLTTAGVGTGATGLPIAQHQLGFVPSSPELLVFAAGDKTLSYAESSLTLNTDYKFSTGWLDGFTVGAVYSRKHDVRAGYAVRNAVRQLYYQPNRDRVDLRVGYMHKFGRFIWTTQLGVQNVADELPIMISYTSAGGISSVSPLGAPRTWVWTNTIRF